MKKPIFNLILILLGLLAVLAAQAQTVTSDKPDYAPRSTAIFTGADFAPGETVTLKVKNLNYPCGTVSADSSYLAWTAPTNALGAFTTSWTVCDCPGDSLRLKVTGMISGLVAYAYFTDSGSFGYSTTPGNSNTVAVLPSGADNTTLSVDINAPKNNGAFTPVLSFTGDDIGIAPDKISLSAISQLFTTTKDVDDTNTFPISVSVGALVPADTYEFQLFVTTPGIQSAGGWTFSVVVGNTGTKIESLSISQQSESVQCGTGNTISYNLNATRGASGTVNAQYTLSGLPMGVTYGFNPESVTSSGGNAIPGTMLSLIVPGSLSNGNYPFTVFITDGSEQATAEGIIVVIDNIAPTPDVQALLDVIEECSVNNIAAPTATDDCGGLIVGTTTDPTSYTEQSTYEITWTYDDGNGNVSTQTQQVIIDDVTKPVADVEELADVTAECGVENIAAPTATDNCAGQIVGTTTDPTSYTEQGTYEITWTYDDGNGNVSTQTQQVIIDDVTKPVADVEELADVTAECGVENIAAPTATDNCAGQIVGTTTDPTSYTDQGTYEITWTYDDGNGNVSTQTQQVIIDDVTKPVADVEELADVTAECGVENIAAPTATDNCAGQIVGTTTDPTSYTEQGTYEINWTYDDGNGNVSTQTQQVIIDDITKPVADVEELADVTAECGVENIAAPTATDNCAGQIVGTTTDPTSYTEQGTYEINWTYDDGNGNVSTQTQQVIIDDVTKPVADIEELADVTAECGVENIAAPTATDNCAGQVVGTTTDPTSYTEQGTYEITWTYDDGNGNVSTQTQQVIIDDVTKPVADVEELADVTAECGVENIAAPTATDNCAGQIVGTTTDPTSYTEQGTYEITWTYDDHNGNSSSQTQKVVVKDVSAPIVITQNKTVYLNSSGIGAITAAAINNGSNDPCGIASMSIDRSSFNCDDVGQQIVVTLTVTDNNGNTATGTAVVSVVNNDPTIVMSGLPNAPIQYSSSGNQVNLTVTLFDVEGNWKSAELDWDNGGSKVPLTAANGTCTKTFTYTAPGVYNVQVTVKDGCKTTVASQYVVIYDPNGGFLTGGGWINSGAGAYVSNPTLTGKANFGFVSKYKKGSNVPEGNTEFQFHAGSLNFASSAYDQGSLVIAKHQAIYKGNGTINGAGNYGFMVSAVDGQVTGGGGIDKFRIKIWDKNNGDQIVYDNDLGLSDDGIPSTALSGGSIVIHEVKAGGKAAREDVVVMDEISLEKLSVYPNPIEQTVHVTFTTPAKTPVNFNIVDTNGRSLLVKDEAVNPEGKYDIHVGDLNLRAGLYVLRVAQGTQLKTIKLLKK